MKECKCGRKEYDERLHRSCYECYIERRADYLTCLECGVRWHSPEYDACYSCSTRWSPDERATRVEANRTLRAMIMYRDGNRCVDCGSGENLQVDHLKPRAKGGDAMPWNLQVLCGDCNWEKGARWWPGCAYDLRRRELFADYFLQFRSFLTDEQRAALVTQAAVLGRGYRPPPPLDLDTDRYEALYPEMFDR